jgi:WD40 repeat protein
VPPAATAVTLTEAIECLAWSSEGNLIAAGDLDGTLAVASPAGDTPARHLPPHLGGVLALAWHPDRPLLATGGTDGTVALHDIATGATIRIVTGGRVHDLQWSPSGAQLAIAAGPAVLVVDPAGTHLAAFPLLAGTVHALAWIAGPARLAAGTRGAVTWLSPSAPAHEPVAVEPVRGAAIAFATDPARRRLAVADLAGELHITDHRSGDEVHVSGWDHIAGLAWDRRGRRLAMLDGPEVTVWRLAGVRLLDDEPIRLHGHTHPVTALAYQGDVLATSDEGGLVARWPTSRLHDPIVDQLPVPVRALGWQPGTNTLAAGTADGRLQLLQPGR